MAFAPSKIMNGPKMQTKMSTWTPLNHQPTNDKVFEERGELLGKWFDKWTDTQRRRVLMILFERCSLSQLRFCQQQLWSRVPAEAVDLATFLPRVLSLYIFSFLDPRSLCRCAQVSWNWKHVCELDQLWMPKCVRLGWYINFPTTPFEQGIWKRHYIEMVRELNVSKPKTPPNDDFVVADVQPLPKESPAPGAQTPSGRAKRMLPPWRGSDKHPTDTVRFNYLDNCHPIEQARQARKKGGGLTPDLSQQAYEQKQLLSSSNYKMRKVKLLMSMSLDIGSGQRGPARPHWAGQGSAGYPVSRDTAKALAGRAEWNAGVRPGPVRVGAARVGTKGKSVSLNIQRTSVSSPQFDSQPWRVSGSEKGSDEE